MRVVIDANVFISGLLSRNGPLGQILDAWIDGLFSIFFSPQIAAEIQRGLEYPRIRERLRPRQASQFIKLLFTAAEWVDGNLILTTLTQDPSDNIYLSCAVEAKADYLITGNLKHFSEAGNPFQGIVVITPRQFIEILQG
jgi:putative PIN family toxin of toxin-antitoxin system